MKSANVPTSRNALNRQRQHAEFIQRGMVAIERTVIAGDGITAETVLAKLEKKLAAARKTKHA